MTKRAWGNRDRMVSIASTADSLSSARSSGTLLSAAISRFGLPPASIDQLVSCLHQFLAFRVRQLVHQRTVLFHDYRALGFLLATGFAALHSLKLRCARRYVNGVPLGSVVSVQQHC